MNKALTIDGKEVEFKATARTQRVYNQAFGTTLMGDLNKLATKLEGAEDSDKQLSVCDLTVFENLAWVMAGLPCGGVENWLDQFKVFSIYEILPELVKMIRGD